jgi:vesicular inhibitory amino acid transporter
MPIRSYPDIGEAAFGSFGRAFINFLFLAELFGAGCMFLVLMGDHLAVLCPAVPSLFGLTQPQMWVIFSALIVLPTTWTSELRLLSYTSLLGVSSSLVLAIVLFAAGVEGPAAPGQGGSLVRAQPMHAVGELEHIPLALGLVMAGYSGHACLPSINTSMRRRSEYPMVLNASYVCTLAIYLFVGLIGYMMYGDLAHQEVSLNVRLSSPGWASTCALWLIVINPATKFGTTLHTGLVEAVESVVVWEKQSAVVLRTCIRTSLTFLIALVSVSVPSFARVVSFVGASCCFVVSGAFPVACYIKLFSRSMTWWSIACHWLLLVFCGACAIVGSWSALYGAKHAAFL